MSSLILKNLYRLDPHQFFIPIYFNLYISRLDQWGWLIPMAQFSIVTIVQILVYWLILKAI